MTAPADVEWAVQSKTLIIALQTGCHFCDKGIKLPAVLPSSVEESGFTLTIRG